MRSIPNADAVTLQLEIRDSEGTPYATTTQRWVLAGVDADDVLATRPILRQILADRSTTTIVDSTRAAALGVEVAGCIPLVLEENRSLISLALEVIESCASSPEQHLRIERLSVESSP